MKHLAMVSLILSLSVMSFIYFPSPGMAQQFEHSVLTVHKAADFTIDGKGSANEWNRTDWITLPQVETTKRESNNKAPVPTDPLPSEIMSTRAKVLYSDTGLYFLFQSEDRKLQATQNKDFMELWWEDVVEIFLWPDESDPIYFEYQLSPLNHVRMSKHKRGPFPRQLLYHEHKGDHRSIHKTSVKGGEKKSLGSINQWTAEIYIPFKLLELDQNTFPEPKTQWRANLYRFDYDTGDRARWEWQPVDGANHDIERFGTFLFE